MITEKRELKNVPLADLIPYARNPRKNDPAVQRIAASLKEYGLVKNSIVVDEDMVLITGHTTTKAMQALKWQTAPEVTQAFGLTEAQKKAYRIADNRLGELAEWDEELLALEIEDLKDLDFDLDLSGFDEKEIEKITGAGKEVHDDDFEPPAEVQTDIQRGDLFTLGRHRLLCGDSTSAEDVGRLMEGKKADLLLTDPPYGINIVNTGRVGIDAPAGFGKVGTRGMVKARTYHNIEGDDHPFDPRPFLDLAPVVMLFGGNNFASRLPDSPAWLVWDKKAEKGADHNNFSDVELVWTNLKQKSCPIYRHLWSGLLREGDRNVELKDRVHPTQKPVGLIAAILSDHSNPGALCLDPFLGSGTTLVACEQLGRTCYGMEISPQYCQVIIDRWEKLTGQKAARVDAH
ncbi:MAG: DNA methyltransferase [Bacteroidales bacterium]|jgi:hypothetical protein